jgi:hypothetical protein
VITTFATSNGTDTTFDFGSGDVLVLQGIVDEFDLVGRIDFV